MKSLDKRMSLSADLCWCKCEKIGLKQVISTLPAKGPDAVREFSFILQKYLSSVPFYECARYFFSHQNFVKSYQTSKAPSSCLGAGRIFVKRKNCQILQSAGVNVNENANQVNLIDLAFKESIQAEARQNI